MIVVKGKQLVPWPLIAQGLAEVCLLKRLVLSIFCCQDIYRRQKIELSSIDGHFTLTGQSDKRSQLY